MPDFVNGDNGAGGALKPRVSVIIPLYNHEKFVENAIQSVLTQSYADLELIIINDGSTDKSEEVVKGIDDRRIRYFSQTNLGAPNTINRGVQLARGEFVSILNSDDVYDINRIEECVRIFSEDPSLGAVFSYIECINEKGEYIKSIRGREHVWSTHTEETSFKADNNMVLDLLAGNFLITTSNLFCRKNVFDKIGYFSNLRYAHDYEFFLRLCYSYKAHIIGRPLLKYRIHDANTLREDDPEVNFEVGLTLASFFLTYGIGDIIPCRADKKNIYEVMMKFYNSVNTYKADRLIMVLLVFGMAYDKEMESFLKILTEVPANPLRDVCVRNIENLLSEPRTLRKDKENLQKAAQILKADNELLQKESQTLRNDNEILQKYSRTLTEGAQILRADNEILQKDSRTLRNDNEILLKDSRTVMEDNEILQKEAQILRADNEILQKEAEDVRQIIHDQQAKIRKLDAITGSKFYKLWRLVYRKFDMPDLL